MIRNTIPVNYIYWTSLVALSAGGAINLIGGVAGDLPQSGAKLGGSETAILPTGLEM